VRPLRPSYVVSRARGALHACGRAWREGGAAGLGHAVVEAAYWRLHPRVRRWAAELPRQRELDEAFDREFGVDTAGEMPLSDIGLPADEVRRGHGLYRPVWAPLLREALDRLPIDFARFTFVDYGSGKGKALLLASDYPFAEIVGVEFARPLHEAAVRNVERYSSPRQRCRAIRSVCMDARAFDPPERPLVCFFFNPFDEATLAETLERVRASVRRHPRDALIVYVNARSVAEQGRVFRRPYLRRVAAEPLYLVYRVAG
jgi:hypothetical protein